jgi:activating signal cointegrator complex subunit 1
VYVPGVRGRGSGQGHGHGKNRAKLTIDATELLEEYEDFEWMKDVRVDTVAICRMGAKKGEGRSGEESYVVEGEVSMP